MRLTAIFTPNDLPTVTYVPRAELRLEETLKAHYETPNIVISVIGPSKSGKTVLIKKVIPEDRIIPVSGAGIRDYEQLWDRVLSWMGAPSETSSASNSSNEVSVGAQAEGKAGIPLLAEGSAGGSVSGARSWGREKIEHFRRSGLPQVIKEIGGSDYVVFLDDFHYIDEFAKEEIGKQIKAACDNGVKILCASVPHRKDDVVRSNPELRGRVGSIDIGYWRIDELVRIPRAGFGALNAEIAPAIERELAIEALGSPQLMQIICLNLCYVLGISEPLEKQSRIEISRANIVEALLRTSAFADFSKLTSALHTGARTRGAERKIHNLVDGSHGDVYRAILLALRAAPVKLSFTYDDITKRVRANCIEDPPSGSSITSALEQMHTIAEKMQPTSSPLVWDNDTLEITDPYFLFFVRSSEKLNALGAP